MQLRGRRGRQLEIEDRSPRGGLAVADLPAHRVDDAVAHGQAEPGAFTDGFRGEERLKQLGLVLGRHAGTRVLDLQDYAPAFVTAANGDPPRQTTRLEDRLLRVDDEVERDLLQLGKDGHYRTCGLAVDEQLDVLGLQTALAQLGDRRDDVADPDLRGLARLLPREQREIADDPAGARALALNQAEVVVHRLGKVVLHLQQLR